MNENETKMSKEKILISGLPNTVLRIFIEMLIDKYEIFLISYGSKFQYSRLKELLGKNLYLINGNSPRDFLKMIIIVLKILSKNKIKTLIVYHNHFIKNGLLILLVKWLNYRITRIYFPYDIHIYSLIKEFKYETIGKISFFKRKNFSKL